MYTVLYKLGGLSAEEIRSFCELHKGRITSKSLVQVLINEFEECQTDIFDLSPEPGSFSKPSRKCD